LRVSVRADILGACLLETNYIVKDTYTSQYTIELFPTQVIYTDKEIERIEGDEAGFVIFS
jgi:hypothetical protein